MTPEEAAELLNGQDYPLDSPKVFAQMRDNGLVAVYGESDDLMEFKGAISEEIGAFNGTTAYLDEYGLILNACSSDDCPHFALKKKRAATIEAVWCPDDTMSWAFKTNIPHVTFDIMEDSMVFCRGIIFRLRDVESRLGFEYNYLIRY